jgi:hypothetical protein
MEASVIELFVEIALRILLFWLIAGTLGVAFVALCLTPSWEEGESDE